MEAEDAVLEGAARTALPSQPGKNSTIIKMSDLPRLDGFDNWDRGRKYEPEPLKASLEYSVLGGWSWDYFSPSLQEQKDQLVWWRDIPQDTLSTWMQVLDGVPRNGSGQNVLTRSKSESIQPLDARKSLVQATWEGLQSVQKAVLELDALTHGMGRAGEVLRILGELKVLERFWDALPSTWKTLLAQDALDQSIPKYLCFDIDRLHSRLEMLKARLQVLQKAVIELDNLDQCIGEKSAGDTPMGVESIIPYVEGLDSPHGVSSDIVTLGLRLGKVLLCMESSWGVWSEERVGPSLSVLSRTKSEPSEFRSEDMRKSSAMRSSQSFLEATIDQDGLNQKVECDWKLLEDLPGGGKLVKLRPPDPKYRVLLALNGGGVKGIIPAIVLKALEDVVKEEVHEITGEPLENLVVDITNCFDVVAGTSAGSILGLYLASGGGRQELYESGGLLEGHIPGSAEGAITLVSELAPKIFKASSLRKIPGIRAAIGALGTLYRGKKLKSAMDMVFGNKTMKDLKVSSFIPALELNRTACVAFSCHNQSCGGEMTPEYMRLREIHTSQPDNEPESREQLRRMEADFPLKVVAGASSSAPVYFPTAKHRQNGLGESLGIDGDEVRWVDGGLYANDPSLHGIQFMADIFGSENNPLKWEQIAVLSLGTGCTTEPSKKQYSGLISWAFKLPSTLLNTQVYSHRSIAMSILNREHGCDRYFLIDKSVGSDSKYYRTLGSLDAADKLSDLQDFAKELARENKEQLRKFVRSILLKQ